MGGDRAPQIVIEGADRIACQRQDVKFLFFGDSKKVLPIAYHCRYLRGRFEMFHTDEAVPADEKPSNALRRLTKSSMRLAIDAVKEGRADAMVSAGNTGALMAISKVVLRSLSGINRPAIVTSLPNCKNRSTIFLDMGANIDCDSEILFQFAIMGKAYAKAALNYENPKIGLLNVGSEESKGHEELKKTAQMLKESSLAIDFIGYVEGDDLSKGEVEVIVTDGFTGNIALKAIEGTAKLISQVFKQGFTSSIFAKIGYLLASFALHQAIKKIDPRMHNGAMLIGLNGVVVKSHGSTDSLGFSNAIRVAISLLQNRVNDKILAEISNSKALKIDTSKSLE